MMLVHIVRPVFMVFTATIGAGRLSPARWRQAVGLLQASFAVFQMVVLIESIRGEVHLTAHR